MTKPPTPDHCALCGAEIPPKAHACPECGADERTGWREQSVYDGIDLPDDEETQAADRRSQQKRDGHRWLWWLVAATVILTLTLGALGISFKR